MLDQEKEPKISQIIALPPNSLPFTFHRIWHKESNVGAPRNKNERKKKATHQKKEERKCPEMFDEKNNLKVLRILYSKS
jgi:hypothetical protein